MKRKLLYLFVAITLVLSLSGVATPVRAATITPDGNPVDWAGIAPVVTEPGDSSPPGSPDITKVFLTSDNNNLYIRIDAASMVAGALHVGIDSDMDRSTGYNTNTDNSNKFSQSHYMGIDYEVNIKTGGTPSAALYSVPTSNWTPSLIGSLSFGLSPPGQPFVAEVAVPLSSIPYALPWKLVFWVNPSGQPATDEAPDIRFIMYPEPKMPFVSDRDGNLEIYKKDGSNQIRLTNFTTYDNMPVPSPDGTMIVFVSNRAGAGREIYTMDSDGSNQTRLTDNGVTDEWPTWAQGGKSIVFAANYNENFDIYSINATDGSGLTRLTDNPAADSMPAFSSGKIAFVSLRDGDYSEIYVMNGNGTNQTRLTYNPARDGFPAWSPDDSQIAFSTNRDGNFEVYVMNADGSNQTNLSNNPAADDWQPFWSYDGTKIAFTTNRDGNWEVYNMSPTGDNQTNITNSSANEWLRGKWMWPTVTTENATEITDVSVSLNGTLNALGRMSPVDVSFDWGLAGENYTHSTPWISKNATGSFGASLYGLTANTTYHFRAKASGDGPAYGADMEFTTAVGPSETSPSKDIALNPSGTGYPSPLESDAGWGGGSYPWQIVDGIRYYPGEWERGLAFTYASPGNDWRQATINFGENKTFNRVVIWHHGLEHVPNTYKIQYWNSIGSNWTDAVVTGSGHAFLKYPTDQTNWWNGWSIPTENTFEPVTSSKVRFYFYNGDITHGWIYEFEVYNDAVPVTPPGSISGHVYESDNVTPIQGAKVVAFDYGSLSDKWEGKGIANTAPDGSYKINGLTTGEYGIRVDAAGFASEWFDDTIHLADAVPVSVVAPGETTNISFSLEPGGSISGRVFESDNITPIANLHIFAVDKDTQEWMGGSVTNATGYYTIWGLTSREYLVRTNASFNNLPYADEWYDNVYDRNLATPVPVTVPGNVPNINFSLEAGGSISGHVYQSDGVTPVEGVKVAAIDYDSLSGMWAFYGGAMSAPDGSYIIPGLPVGQYGVYAEERDYYYEFYNGKFYPEEADPVPVSAANVTEGVDFNLDARVPRATVDDATADGVAWLVAQQNPDGSWGTNFQVSKTGLAVLKLETHASSIGYSPLDPAYPYSGQVQTGIDFLFANAFTTNISEQAHGNPDTNFNGIGIYFSSPNATGEKDAIVNYDTAIAAMAISASDAPGAVVSVIGSAMDGWVYSDVLQDTVDYLAWGQTDYGWGRGGWSYGPMDNQGDRGDQSNSGWVSLALAYAESSSPTGFSLYVPGFVRSELGLWIDHVQDPVGGDANDGGAHYTGPNDPNMPDANMLRTGNLLQQLAFVGDTLDSPRVQAALDYLGRHWYDQQGDTGWRGYNSNYQATYTVMKGLEAFQVVTLNGDNGTIDWFQDFTDTLLWEQNLDGSWPRSNFDDGERILSTEWALLTLEKVTVQTKQAPDLVVIDKHEEWVDQQAGTYVVYYAIKNIGNLDMPLSHVTLMVDNVEIETREVPYLTVGDTFYDSFNVLTLSDNTDEIIVSADSWSETDELNEQNNFFYNIWPAQLDLTLAGKWEYWVGQGNADYRVSYRIENSGNNMIPGGYYVGLTVDNESIEMQEITQPLSPGDWFIGTFDTVIQLTGDKDFVTVTVDVADNITEVNEENNSFTNVWPPVSVRVVNPAMVAAGAHFNATINITQVNGFDAANYDISFDPTVLELTDLSSANYTNMAGQVGGTVIPVDVVNLIHAGTGADNKSVVRIVQNVPDLSGATGFGYLAVLHFHVIGSFGESTNITLFNGTLSDNTGHEISAMWSGNFVEVTMLPGDVNGDGTVNALDITKVERIIVGFDQPTPGSDANQDGKINAVDITAVERFIVGLPVFVIPSFQWSKAFGGTGDEAAVSSWKTSDEGYILAGYTNSFGAGLNDVYLVKTDSSGNFTWGRTFGGADYDEANSVQQTADGGYIVAGRTFSFGAGGDDVYLIKTNSSGTITWTRTFGGTDYDWANSVRQTTDGGYIIAGTTYSFGAGAEDVWLIKTDSSGNITWSRTFGGINSDQGVNVRPTADGGYVIVGSTNSFGVGGSWDIWLIKTDSSGNMTWSRNFGGSGTEEGWSVWPASDGGFILTGYATSWSSGSDDVYLVKTDASGNMTWSKTFGGLEADHGVFVRQTSDGGYIISGRTYSFGAGGWDVYLIKTDSAGNRLWSRAYGGAGDEMGYSIHPTADNGYVVAGLTNSFGAGNFDVYLLKVK